MYDIAGIGIVKKMKAYPLYFEKFYEKEIRVWL